jgi:cysteine desulfurase
MIYLDNSATTCPDRRVVEVMREWMTQGSANPSSPHGPGVRAAEAIDRAARHVAALAGPGPWEVVFTSGGTEANALAILGCARGPEGRGVVTTSIEHPSVLRNVARLEGAGARVERVRPGNDGRVPAERILEAVDSSTVLVSIMLANNEIGTLQPVEEVARAVRRRHPDIAIHVDAVQAAGRLPLASALEGVDLVTLSGHKIHGPQGTGALLVRRGSRRPAPLYAGGEQQGGLRPGTENVPGIVGFGLASELARTRAPDAAAHLEALARALIEALGDGGPPWPAYVDVPRLPGHVVVAFRGVPAETVVHAMEERGFVISSGSACHSRSAVRSHVLEACGLAADTDLVRLVASHTTTADEMHDAGTALREVVGSLIAG